MHQNSLYYDARMLDKLPRYATGHYMTQCSLWGTLMAQFNRITTTPEL